MRELSHRLGGTGSSSSSTGAIALRAQPPATVRQASGVTVVCASLQSSGERASAPRLETTIAEGHVLLIAPPVVHAPPMALGRLGFPTTAGYICVELIDPHLPHVVAELNDLR